MQKILAVIGGTVVACMVVSLLMSLGGWLALQAQSGEAITFNLWNLGGGQSVAASQYQQPPRPSPVASARMGRDVDCELQYDYITISVPAELVRGRVDGFRGQQTEFEPVVGANDYFDRAGCGRKYEWYRGQDGEQITIHVLASDWPSEEAVLAALRAGQPIFGVLTDCGNPIVLNPQRLPERTANELPPPTVAPTATRVVVPSPPKRETTVPATAEPEKGQCPAFEGGACLP